MGCFSSRPKCIICDEMAEKILYPCGHYCLCAVCANKLVNYNQNSHVSQCITINTTLQCPVCRTMCLPSHVYT